MEIADGIRDGLLQSPTICGNSGYFAVRIFGTGAAYRSGVDEYSWRDPDIYITDEVVRRCNGMPVIFYHPIDGMLDSESFRQQIVGTIILPYIKGEEIWGIARILDEDTINILSNLEMSTSPAVKFARGSGTRKIIIDGAKTLLLEGLPQLIDHLAICEHGVWDKLGEPSGVISDSVGVQKVPDDAPEVKKADADTAPPAWAADMMKRMDSFGHLMERMDAIDKKMDESFEKWAKEEKEEPEHKEDSKKRADAEDKKEESEEEKKGREEKEKADAQMKADATRRLDELEAKLRPTERSDAETAECADAQARWDSVAMAFGKSARAPLAGETPAAYRRRLASEYQQHSTRWKSTDLATLPADALFNAEADIRADAMAASRRPVDLGAGQLREIKSQSNAGHRISEFVGDPEGWMAHFKQPMRQRVTGLGLKTN